MAVAGAKADLALPCAAVTAADSSCRPEDAAGPGLNVSVSLMGSCRGGWRACKMKRLCAGKLIMVGHRGQR